MLRRFLFPLFILSTVLLRGQNDCIPDSSKSNYSKLSGFENKIRYSVSLASTFSHLDRPLSECLFKKCLEDAMQQHDSAMIIHTLTFFSTHLMSYGEADTAASCVGLAKKYVSKNLAPRIELKLMASEAEYYTFIEQFPKATGLRYKILKLAYSIKDSTLIAASLHNLGIVYYKVGNDKKADSLIRIAYHINKLRHNTTFLMRNLTMLENIAGVNKNYAESVKFGEEALALAKEVNDYNIICISSCNMADAYYYLGQKKKAYEILDFALGIAVKYGYNEWRKNIYINYERLAILQKDYKSAHFYFKKSAYLKDSMINAQTSRTMADLEMELNKNKVDLLEKENQLSRDKNAQTELLLKKEKIVRYFILGGFGLAAIFLIIVYRNFLEKKKANAKIIEQNGLLEIKNNEIANQKLHLEVKNKEVTDSINYARKIQYTLLANEAVLNKNLGEFFIYFKPKDIVSGDFYWASEIEGKDLFYLALCDSTGHGVPGAFMSLLNINYLNEAINTKGILKPNEVLNYVREGLIAQSSAHGSKDGMDGVLVCWDRKKTTIEYSAAYNKPIRIRNGELSILPYDKMPVGPGISNDSFKLHSGEIKKGDAVYLCSDGYADQFGGSNGKKFKYKQLEEVLLGLSHLPMNKQKEALDLCFEKWRGNLEQVDDVCVIGLKI